ncbi:AAA family ATPase [Alkaliphilus peptidifermentans]|uniref:Stage V sporulation protein K n=1 Tax=Alkaliphilus peptidifermentans DSM 18978 TaxID=1120976 RepID=A0A1G5KLY0_9FIRM|nr:AAA family ATPase [Alkaliphilus peptidifermentans]SCZ01098.1 stage V sporulation protein K [Alkaliphilus peptidifermentans DSM 18978]
MKRRVIYSLQEKYNSLESGRLSTNEFFDSLFYEKEKAAVDSKDVNDEASLESILKELDKLIGLNNVKSLVNEVLAYTDMQKKRKENGLQAQPMAMHMIFKGNPGTGKTTVARLLGKILKAKGILENGHLIEIERADLVGEYIGHTAQKVREQIRKGIGGIIFIDEAYSLARGGEKDFGKEAIDALVKGMEDHKDNLILILAGYQEEMDNFLRVNPGLKSRFPIHMDFEDYTIEELVEIADLMIECRQYLLSISAKAKLFQLLAQKRMRDGLHSGNARLVRNLIEKAIRRQAVRLKNRDECSIQELMMLTREDFE